MNPSSSSSSLSSSSSSTTGRETTPKKEKTQRLPRKRKIDAIGTGIIEKGEEASSSASKPRKPRTPQQQQQQQRTKSTSKDFNAITKGSDYNRDSSSPVPSSFTIRRTSHTSINDSEFNHQDDQDDDGDDDSNNLTSPPPGTNNHQNHDGGGGGDIDDDDDGEDGRSTEASADDTCNKGRNSIGGGNTLSFLDDDEDDTFGGEDDLFGIQLQNPDPQTISAIMAKLSPEQMSRYELFRRSKLPKSHINKIIQNVLGQKAPASASFVVQSAGKLFIGDMVERALTIQSEMDDIGALQPKHLREAYRRYRKGPTSYMSSNISLFKNDNHHF